MNPSQNGTTEQKPKFTKNAAYIHLIKMLLGVKDDVFYIVGNINGKENKIAISLEKLRSIGKDNPFLHCFSFEIDKSDFDLVRKSGFTVFGGAVRDILHCIYNGDKKFEMVEINDVDIVLPNTNVSDIGRTVLAFQNFLEGIDFHWKSSTNLTKRNNTYQGQRLMIEKDGVDLQIDFVHTFGPIDFDVNSPIITRWPFTGEPVWKIRKDAEKQIDHVEFIENIRRKRFTILAKVDNNKTDGILRTLQIIARVCSMRTKGWLEQKNEKYLDSILYVKVDNVICPCCKKKTSKDTLVLSLKCQEGCLELFHPNCYVKSYQERIENMTTGEQCNEKIKYWTCSKHQITTKFPWLP